MQTYTIPYGKNDTLDLLKMEGSPCVSLFMAFTEPGIDFQKNQIKFGNLLEKASRDLLAHGLSADEVSALLSPLLELQTDEDNWSNRNGSLAYFVSETVSACYEIPGRITDEVVVAPHFQIRRLLPLLEADTNYAILALNLGGARLYAADHMSITEMDISDAPEKASHFMVEGERSSVQRHGGAGEGSGSGQYFGHGEEDKNRELATDKFLSRLAGVVDNVLGNSNRHLLLAGESAIIGELRPKLKYAKVLEQVLDGNPKQKTAEQLHEASLPLLKPLLHEVRDATLGEIRRRQATDGAAVADDLLEILNAAQDGAVDSLFIRRAYRESGTYNTEAREIELAEDGSDLANQAALLTLAKGGRVYMSDETELPHSGMLAGLRF